MAVPVGEDLEAVFTSISQRSKLILRRKGEVLAGVVDVLHPVVLCHDVAFSAAGAQQVAARLVGCVLPGLLYQFIYYFLTYKHISSLYKTTNFANFTNYSMGQCFHDIRTIRVISEIRGCHYPWFLRSQAACS